MIVTCPHCSSKYRVRDEVVPAEGAQLKCPECGTLFVAHPPKHSDGELREALERVTTAKETAEKDLDELRRELERTRKEAAKAREVLEAESARFRREGELIRPELVRLEGEVQKLKEDLQRERTDSLRLREEATALRSRADVTSEKDQRILALERELTLAREQLQGQQDERAQMTRLREEVSRLHEELARARVAKIDVDQSKELSELKDQLSLAQKTVGRLTTELETAQELIGRQQVELRALKEAKASASPDDTARVHQLEGEIARLKEQLSRSQGSDPKNQQLAALIAGVTPMLWGLEQSIDHLEPLSRERPDLSGHLRHLQLLRGVLKRLSDAVSESV